MCHYCGCRQIPLIIDYISEHDEARGLGADLLEAMDQRDRPRARALLAEMADSLRRHWRGEEDGLFAVMKDNDEYADYIGNLVLEHRQLDALLASADLEDPSDEERVRAAIEDLAQHIRKEEDGLFPAALIALDGADWTLAIAAWQSANPQSELQTGGA